LTKNLLFIIIKKEIFNFRRQISGSFYFLNKVMKKIRNIAIIAHVDHGKTTLVDALLKQSKTKLNKEVASNELIMDNNELEKERGITIFSKNASIEWNDYKINIIDTPGHADFGGEVERVLKMAEGCLLLVDAKEGPMPQTRFVLKKALEMNLKIIVVINKIDKPGARPDYALNKTFDLFVELGASDNMLDFPIIYSSAKQGLAGLKEEISSMTDISPLLETIINTIPEPNGDEDGVLQILVTSINSDNFKGRVATGKVFQGKIINGQKINHINREGEIKSYKITALMSFVGLDKVIVEQAIAGDIIAIAGIPDVNIGETITDINSEQVLPLLKIEEPTVKMKFLINDSPFAGQEGQFTTSRQIKERLDKELENDMALKVEDDASGSWIISGRGELHLAILIERLRREGYEFQVGQPKVIVKEIDGKKLVPYEQIFIETPEEYSGSVIQKLNSRQGELKNMNTENNITYLDFIIPSRGLFGYRTEFLTDTKGLGIMHTSFYDYMSDKNDWKEKDRGSLVAFENGITNSYGLINGQSRGLLFYGPGEKIYKGQIVGQNSRKEDIEINICKTKQLSNMRSKGEGVSEHINAPKKIELEYALEYIGDDELVEATPKSIRMRKMVLDKTSARKKVLGIKS
jgi:GTP-binding protein